MPMPPYQIFCYSKDCKNLAQYKIAARWSDGVVSELKTYGLCCESCLKTWFLRGRRSQQGCQLTIGEILEPSGIYLLERGRHDQALKRMTDLEERVLNQASAID